MKKGLLTMILAIVLMAANAQTEAFNLGKLVSDTITNVDQKYLVFVQDISRAIQNVQGVTNNEERQTGSIKNKAAYEKMLNDVTVLINGYYSDFVDVTVNTQYIDEKATQEKLINIRSEITKLNNCSTCDSALVAKQLPILKYEADRLNKWLKQK